MGWSAPRGAGSGGCAVTSTVTNGRAWDILKAKCEDCSVCPNLCKERLLSPYGKPTFGYGNLDHPTMFIGEAPGHAGCGTTGIPFTKDRSGELYNWVLSQYGKTMDDVYTTNIVKCCPAKNRTPTSKELTACSIRFLYEEIRLLKPIKIIGLGRSAHTRVMGIADYIPHPAYAIRNGAAPGNVSAIAYSKLFYNVFTQK